jgi:DNA-binding response OmpR family regulator
MRRLRQKVERNPDRPVHVVTVRGVGYRLVGVEDEAPSVAPGTSE